jgi:hypothetical protein
MKIATISININTINHNYGAILHSWAFQQYLLENVNNLEETILIDYIPNYVEGFNLKYPVLSYLKKSFRDTILWSVYLFSNLRKYNKIERFINNNFIKTKEKYNENDLSTHSLDYDVYICESDVIWDPNHYGSGFERAFFLDFDYMKSKKRISYAASLGNAEFTEENKIQYTNLLKNIDYISIREKYGADYTQKFTKKPVFNVLDPTLLLDSDDYEKICSKKLIKEKYLLIYFPLEYNSKIIKEARSYAKVHNMKVVEISRYVWNKFHHKVYTAAGVDEFLSLIKHAELVFTNSFHGVCFSIIYKKEFYSFTRKTGKKIENLCTLFDLKARFINQDFVEDFESIDYSKVFNILNIERSKSIAFIENALQ